MDNPTPVRKYPSGSTPGPKLLLAAALITLAALAVGILLWQQQEITEGPADTGEVGQPPADVAEIPAGAEVKTFESGEQFREWLAEASASEAGAYGWGAVSAMSTRAVALEAAPAPTADMELGIGGEQKAIAGEDVYRYSETNVQVAGIDEPDIVKTDGQEIYYSPERYYYWRRVEPVPMMELDIIGSPESKALPPYRPPGVKALKAWPPAELGVDAEIETAGELLLRDGTLVVLSSDRVAAYDVSDPRNPGEKWQYDLESRHQVVATRLYGDDIYLITQAGINYETPCPIVPLIRGEERVTVPCGSVYHPVTPVPSDVTYTSLVIGVHDGEVKDRVSFVGSRDSSAVYMSVDNLYVTYSFPGDLIAFIYGFLEENADLMPSQVRDSVRKLRDYDISLGAKMLELQVIFERWMSGLDEDELLRLENEMSNRMEDYHEAHRRELQQTGIIKLDIDGLEVSATGTVPGSPLNQFSLDEYEGHLRIATTVGGRRGFGWRFGFGTGESVNDVYVLDGSLRKVGEVLDMGLGERIYSARFIQDKGYVVTFRETDPFYVLDLSDPASPELKGELKIPGYSSYLHPITKDKILGTGKEGSSVKLSLFDVSDPTDPREVSKYTLDEYWSEILNTHHAFLMDTKHEVFFLPGGKGGYVFSYTDDRLSLTKAVSGIRAKRAVFINDYLYILGDDRAVVLNEADWERVNGLEF